MKPKAVKSVVPKAVQNSKGYQERQKSKKEANKQTSTLATANMAHLNDQYENARTHYLIQQAILSKMTEYVDAYRTSEDVSVKENVNKYRSIEIPLCKQIMEQERQRMDALKKQIDEGKEPSYFDVDDIPEDGEFDASAEDVPEDATPEERKSFLARRKEAFETAKAEKLQQRESHKNEFGNAFTKNSEALMNYRDATSGMRKLITNVNDLDVSDPDFASKLADIRSTLAMHQDAVASNEDAFKASYTDMQTSHNEYLDTIGISKKYRMSSIHNAMQTFVDKRKSEFAESMKNVKDDVSDELDTGVEKFSGFRVDMKDKAKDIQHKAVSTVGKVAKVGKVVKQKFAKTPKTGSPVMDEAIEIGDEMPVADVEADDVIDVETATEAKNGQTQILSEAELSAMDKGEKESPEVLAKKHDERVAMAKSMPASGESPAPAQETHLPNGRPLPEMKQETAVEYEHEVLV